MSQNILQPYATTLVSSAARTTTSNSGNIEFPVDAEDISFILSSAAGTGTSPTLDVAIQVTPDNGTTYFTVERFAQVTSSIVKDAINMTRKRHHGEAASYLNIADTGGSLVNNVALSRKIRILWTIGGTNPSFTFGVYCIANHNQG